jgi:hypothetical protein
VGHSTPADRSTRSHVCDARPHAAPSTQGWLQQGSQTATPTMLTTLGINHHVAVRCVIRAVQHKINTAPTQGMRAEWATAHPPTITRKQQSQVWNKAPRCSSQQKLERAPASRWHMSPNHSTTPAESAAAVPQPPCGMSRTEQEGAPLLCVSTLTVVCCVCECYLRLFLRLQ